MALRASYIPHGFYSSALPLKVNGRPVVGTHTRPDERIDLLNTLEAIIAVLARAPPGATVGHIGGRGLHISCADALSKARSVAPTCDIEVVPDYNMTSDASRKRVLVVSNNQWEPDEYSPTYDLRCHSSRTELAHVEGLSLRASIPVVSSSFARRYLPGRPTLAFSEIPTPATVAAITDGILTSRLRELENENQTFARQNDAISICRRLIETFGYPPHSHSKGSGVLWRD